MAFQCINEKPNDAGHASSPAATKNSRAKRSRQESTRCLLALATHTCRTRTHAPHALRGGMGGAGHGAGRVVEDQCLEAAQGVQSAAAEQPTVAHHLQPALRGRCLRGLMNQIK